MGAHCGRHQFGRGLQDNVEQLSNTMLRMQMSCLGADTRAALDLRWLLESNNFRQNEYLDRLRQDGHTIKIFLINCICPSDLRQRDIHILTRLTEIIVTNMSNLDTLEFWHVCQSNSRLLFYILSQAVHIKNLKLEYGIEHAGRHELHLPPSVDLTRHLCLARLEFIGFQDVHLRRLLRTMRLPSQLSTLLIRCDTFSDVVGGESNDKSCLSVETVEKIFALPALEKLVLHGVSLGAKEPVHRFCELLTRSRVTELSLASCLLDERFAHSLVESLALSESLLRIHLTLDVTDHHLSTYLHLFSKFLPQMKLVELELGSYCERQENEDPHDVFLAFLDGITQCKQITVLALPWIYGWNPALSKAVGRIILSCRSLRKLSINIQGDNQDPEGWSIIEAAHHSSSIECIEFSPMHQWSTHTAKLLESICQRNFDCRVYGDRFRCLLQEDQDHAREAFFGAAVKSISKKQDVVFRSLLMAVHMFAIRLEAVGQHSE